MPSLTKDQLNELLKRKNVATRNPELSGAYFHPRPFTFLEPDIINVALPAASVQKTSRTRFRVRLYSVRERLIDEDNLSAKYIVDVLRYNGIITDDCPHLTTIQVEQRKCAKGEIEHVEIIVEKI